MIILTENIQFNINKNFEELTHSPPILFLHGFTGSLHIWDNIRDKLRYPSIALDLPGHGNSFIVNYSKPYSFESWNRDLQFVLDELKIPKVILCGYSMGGRLALSFAINHPERIHSLILESASPGIDFDAEREKRYKSDLELIDNIETNFTPFLEDWCKLPFFKHQQIRNQEEWQKLKEIRESSNPTELAYALKHLSVGIQPSYWEMLDIIEFPVLLITGGEDEKFCKIAKKMNHQIKNSSHKIIQDSGHTANLESINKYLVCVQNFIKFH
ncbi:MAG: 2-succinyl-6-hydroxy-2,4-cyclohexadiene-1-carboxylate synthase [Candidatus Marinimicrobia bacterium]|nr:2-succinyl-6-hydroxy-2,4-cyclohexadiene-1-carboxylate synthase [Candidatus Neomarinimicrobiota bacterium]MBL7023536.1 2-succinyl-6-hydroxy-2,4-cyclohexadiene-1-carboxylate synthase [Candidatus Neomarinimicrobiota bacterium]MBL7109560.1 2-succinyl-6-hydroxy-2,4-cyclohexadiene-1-carboxylate synthase [Candidatus Neomarinimicrobiota bacterium]